MEGEMQYHFIHMIITEDIKTWHQEGMGLPVYSTVHVFTSYAFLYFNTVMM